MKCPICKRPGKPLGNGYFQCSRGHTFDPDDEGIVTNHMNPAKAAENKEAFLLRQAKRKTNNGNR